MLPDQFDTAEPPPSTLPPVLPVIIVFLQSAEKPLHLEGMQFRQLFAELQVGTI